MSKQTKITKSARGEDCSLQIFPYCNMNPETTVLAHINSDGKGMAIKSGDLSSCYACNICHDIIDGRMKHDLSELEVLKCVMRGMQRTIAKLLEKGLIKI